MGVENIARYTAGIGAINIIAIAMFKPIVTLGRGDQCKSVIRENTRTSNIVAPLAEYSLKAREDHSLGRRNPYVH